MTREERKRQLFTFIHSGNVDAIFELYMEKCLAPGVMPPVGMLASQMIEEILEVEFSDQDSSGK